MVNRVSSLRRAETTRTNSVPVSIGSLKKRARSFLKRRNSAAFRENAEIDIVDAKGWTSKHNEN